MGRSIFIMAAFIIIAALGIGYLMQRNVSFVSREGAEAATKPAVIAVNDKSSEFVQQHSHGNEFEGNRASDIAIDYLCLDAVDCYQREFGILGATSIEEAEWLNENGYPSMRELDRLQALSDEELSYFANTNNLRHMVVYGERLAMRGDEDGISILDSAVAGGSIYAQYALSRVYSESLKFRDPVLASAHLRLAYISGDYKAGLLVSSQQSGLSSFEVWKIDSKAALLREIFEINVITPRPI